MTETNTDALTEILPGLLAPLLMSGTVTDPARAHRAAEQAIAQYQAGTQGELLTISQIVAFALTAIDNLRLSMPDDVSLTMKLRLRGNANALNRASLHATKALDKARADADPIWAEPPETTPIEPPEPVATPSEQQNSHHWANAMTTVAAELQARAPQVPPQQRKSDQLWVEVLASVAGELRQPNSTPHHPGPSKANLFRTTLMSGSGGFPAHLLPKGKTLSEI
jgi:hypothetical protein